MSTARIIRFQHHDVNEPAPWPVGIDERLRVTAGLGPGSDGAYLIGFSEPHTQEPSILAEAGLKDPEKVVGMWPVFSRDDRFFSWGLPVRIIEVAPEPEPEAEYVPEGDGLAADSPGEIE